MQLLLYWRLINMNALKLFIEYYIIHLVYTEEIKWMSFSE